MEDRALVIAEDHPANSARRRLRWLTRGVVMLMCIVLLYLPGHAPEWSLVVPALSPLTTTALLLATWTLPALAMPAAAILLVILWRRRWFCLWVCPTGCCVDGATWLGRRLGRRAPPIPSVGRTLAALILAGSCLGYPLLLWLDPMALWSGAVGAWSVHGGWQAGWGCWGLGLVLLVSLLWPHLWCARVCPLGGLQDVMAPFARWLVGFWRRRAHHRSGAHRELPSSRVARRVFVGGGIGAAWAFWLGRARPLAARPLRPPGAADEQQFSSLCVRCGNCIRVCPTGILSADNLQHGIGGWLAPVVSFDNDYCLESCNACTAVCPSGAILPVARAHKLESVIGVPEVDMTLCLLGADRECAICRTHCPYGAIRFVFDEVHYVLTPRIDWHRCPGCGACQVACPTRPRKAIVVRPRV
ncbi:MAG: 4Fe-4S binding protein [Pirellulaceae bacterium]